MHEEQESVYIVLHGPFPKPSSNVHKNGCPKYYACCGYATLGNSIIWNTPLPYRNTFVSFGTVYELLAHPLYLSMQHKQFLLLLFLSIIFLTLFEMLIGINLCHLAVPFKTDAIHKRVKCTTATLFTVHFRGWTIYIYSYFS